VVGAPDPKTGEAIHAFVVPAGDQAPDPRDAHRSGPATAEHEQRAQVDHGDPGSAGERQRKA
jgi:hypothetical protein